jgi:putative methyltransferase (TIGR04325 family)
MRWFKPSSPPQGYDDEAVMDIVVRKTKALESVCIEDVLPGDTFLPLLLAIACSGYRVMDFGGGAGFHYLAASRAFPDRSFRWAIVEHPLMMKYASGIENENLKLFSSPEAAADWLGGIDLLHSNGVLQYLDRPEEMLRRLLEFRPMWAIWSRLLMGSDAEVQMQVAPLSAHGPGPCPPGIVDREITHKTTVMNRAEFWAAHSDNYRTVWRSADSALFERKTGT